MELIETIKGAFTVRVVRNGDQIYLTRTIVKMVNGAEVGAALFQGIDPTSGALSVDWTVEANQPIVKLVIESARGNVVNISDVAWAYDGSNLSFSSTADSDGWYPSTDGRFKRKMSGSDTAMLKVVANLASISSDVVSNKQITYTVSYVTNSVQDSLTESVDVQIQQSGSDSHSVYIVTNRVELNASNASAVLTAQCNYGVGSVTIGKDGYTMKWLQDGEEISGQTSQSLTVYRNASDGSPYVTGGSVFVAQLYKDGVLVAQDGQRINDTSDEYQVVAKVASNGQSMVSDDSDATYVLSVTRNGESYKVDSSKFSWVLYNALGVQTGSGTGSIVTIKKSHALCTNGNGTTYYSDVDVAVTVTI